MTGILFCLTKLTGLDIIQKTMKSKFPSRSTYLLLLKVGLSLALIGYFIWKLSNQAGGLEPMARKLMNTLKGADPLYLILAMALHPIGFALTSWRWHVLLSPITTPPSFFRLYRLYFMAAFFNNFTFGTVGGDALRAVAGKRFSASLTRSATVVLIEHLSGFVALFLIALTGLTAQTFMGKTAPWLLAGALAALLILIVALILLMRTRIKALPESWRRRLPHRLGDLLDRLIDTLATYRRKPRALWHALGISLVFQTMMVVYYYLICRAMSVNLSLVSALIGIPVMIIMLMVIPAVNGLGVRTTGFGSLLGLSTVQALSGEGIDVLFRLFFGLIGGILFVTDRNRNTGQT